MSKDKTQLLRFIYIDQKIREGMQTGELANCRNMAQEYEVSRKTVLRDIDYLKNQRGAPIAYDSSRKGYYYSEPNYSLPAISLTESDLFAICIARKALKQHENTPVYEKLAAVFRKIEGSLPEKVSVDPTWVNTKLSMVEKHQTRIDQEVWSSVAKGLEQNWQLQITYCRPGQKTTSRRLDPYHIVSYQGEWYVMGYCHLRQGLRTFGLSRIKKAQLLNLHFEALDNFDFEKYWGNRFGIFGNDEEYEVRIRFSKRHAPYITERQWHPTQAVKKINGGGIVLSLTVSHLLEVKRWVLSWGSGVKVLAPATLAEEIREELAKALQEYQEK